MNNDITMVKPDETFEQYKQRIYRGKSNGLIDLTWQQISNLFAENFGIIKNESTWRKECKSLYPTVVEEVAKNKPNVADKDLAEFLLEFKKERVKLSDERTQNNAYVRKMAREETLIEIAKIVVENMSGKKMLKEYVPHSFIIPSQREAIVQISDWHYGIEFTTFVNKFNPDVCVERVSQLLNECKEYFERNPVNKIYVVNLGDLISGRIHNTIRLSSRYDVITQCIHVAELVAEFLNELSSIAPVEYYDCFDNHSRLEPNKADSLDLESLVRIIPWYLRNRFEGNANISIERNIVNGDIIAFPVMNDKWTVGGVHGHKDKPNKVVENLTLFTKVKFDMILTAHLHHFSADERNETLVISNGSLMGTDKYAEDLRLSALPSQNIILINENRVMEDLHRVTFK